jgi:hypothetical protein
MYKCWRLGSSPKSQERFALLLTPWITTNHLFTILRSFHVYSGYHLPKIIMVKLFDISKLRYYFAYHSSKKFSKMSKNIIDFKSFGHSLISQHMITQSFENSQKSVFGRTLEAHMGMKGWFTRKEPVLDLLLWGLFRTAVTFGSIMFRAICAKHRFLQTKYNSIF